MPGKDRRYAAYLLFASRLVDENGSGSVALMNGLWPLYCQYNLHAGQVYIAEISFVRPDSDESLASPVVRKTAEVAIAPGIAVTGFQKFPLYPIGGLCLYHIGILPFIVSR